MTISLKQKHTDSLGFITGDDSFPRIYTSNFGNCPEFSRVKQTVNRKGGVLFKNWVISYVFWWSTIFEKEKVYEAEKEKEGGIDDSILKAEKLQLFTGVSNRGSLVGFLV